MSDPITEEWLAEVGFRWHQLERQPFKHWLLWLGSAVADNGHSLTSAEEIGIEVTRGGHAGLPGDRWFCWLRSDASHRYHRFIHLRHLSTQAELADIVSAISGQAWDPANHRYGSCLTPERAARDREANERFDRQLNAASHPWHATESDPTIGRPLIEHLEAHEEAKRA